MNKVVVEHSVCVCVSETEWLVQAVADLAVDATVRWVVVQAS